VETLCKIAVSASNRGTRASGVLVVGSGDVTSCVVIVIGGVGSGVVSGVGVVVVVACGGMTETSTSSNRADRTGGISCWI
ncbi:hypothetical protein Tco_1495409, partial [Tanacetum coccineum]